MFSGNSWFNSVPRGIADQVKAAGIEGHKKITGITGHRIDNVKPLLEKGEIDVYVWQRSEVGPESPSFLPTLVELGPKHYPNFRMTMVLP